MSTEEVPPRASRAAFDPTAAQFLEAAERIVFESGNLLTVARVPVASIVEAAGNGLSRGAFTHQWPRRVDFEQDLLLYMACGVRDRSGERLGNSMNDVIQSASSETDMASLIAAGVTGAVEGFISTGEMPVIMGLWSAGCTDEAVRNCMNDSWHIARDEMVNIVRLLLAVMRRAMKPGIDIDELCTSLSTMFTSFIVRKMVCGDEPDFGSEQWARNAVAVALACSDPMPD